MSKIRKAWAGGIVSGIATGLAVLAANAADDHLTMGESIGAASAGVTAAAAVLGVVYQVRNA